MTHTLAAIFDNRDDADRARSELVKAGFAAGDIHLNDTSAPAASEDREDSNEGMIEGIKHFFGKLMRSEHHDRHVYREAIKRGHVVLSVDAASSAEADRAADIVEAYNPLDIDDQQSRWRASGWTGGTETLRGGSLNAGLQQAGAGAMQRDTLSAAPLQGQPTPPPLQTHLADTAASVQRADPGTGYSATPDRNDPLGAGQNIVQRRGMRIYPREGLGSPNLDSLAIQRGDNNGVDEDTYFRTHWEDTLAYSGGTYQEFDPAYRYGSSMAGSSAFRDLPWDQAEPELRTNWEHSFPESSWDKFKHAVRGGWERVNK